MTAPSARQAACTPWPCQPGRICATHAPRISPADAAPLIAIFRGARDDDREAYIKRIARIAKSPAAQAVVASAPPLNREQVDTIRRAMGLSGLSGERPERVLPAAPRQVKVERQVLYRYFDACGCLLYVGITNDFDVRDRAHESDPWYELVAGHAVEEVADREAARAAERTAIKGESPAFNIQHLGSPRASTARVHAWLIEHASRAGAR